MDDTIAQKRATTISDARTNRDLVMAQDVTRSGPLTVKAVMPRDFPLGAVPLVGDIEYLERVEVIAPETGASEGQARLLFRFDIPDGAPRNPRMVETGERLARRAR